MVESKWTRLFIITSIVQTFITIIIQSLVVGRNQNASLDFLDKWRDTYSNNNNITANECKTNIVGRMTNIVGENIIILLSNIFLLFFSYDAIFNQNTIQIITVVVVNYAIGIVAAIQIVEIQRWKNQAVECVPGFSIFDFKVELYEVPSVVIFLICATTMGFFTWKLYQQFGWNIYKRIGADLACVVLSSTEKLKSSFLYWFHVVVTVIIFILQALAYRMLREESVLGMKIFIGLWLIPIADFIALLIKSIGTSAQDRPDINHSASFISSCFWYHNGTGNIQCSQATEQTSEAQPPTGRWAIDED
ncbi:14072_t:CDS:2 [Cetraspora pellucida]|uniref:14072_t:CDS:1 n=1 Tax=Cetraspora pellucida TaxID=1433469 RepID=A0A9N9CN09_9GLOM|nr:14072_t:CDS:2 [Cetraspora pellucida]